MHVYVVVQKKNATSSLAFADESSADAGEQLLEQVLSALDTVCVSAVALPTTNIKVVLTESRVTTRGTRTQPYRTADGTWVRPFRQKV